jgi:probable rRNA maturation factor
MNRKFLHHDYVTDVLSFPLGAREALEGEVYVNLDRARQQAVEYGVTFTSETGRLVIHGVLHLLGYDDTTSGPRRRMKKKEDRYVEEWCKQ